MSECIMQTRFGSSHGGHGQIERCRDRCQIESGFYTPTRVKSLFATSILLLLLAGGCVRQQVTVTSDPPGALVYANDQEIGRTPFTRDFIWYGQYDIAVREDGYDPLKVHTDIYAPWWQWAPFDLVSDTMPLTDRHAVHFTLKPASTQPTNNQALMARAQNLQAKLQSP